MKELDENYIKMWAGDRMVAKAQLEVHQTIPLINNNKTTTTNNNNISLNSSGNAPIKERKTLLTATRTMVSTTETETTTMLSTTEITLQFQQLIVINTAITNTGKIVDDLSSSSFLKKRFDQPYKQQDGIIPPKEMDRRNSDIGPILNSSKMTMSITRSILHINNDFKNAKT
ncbi:hypothetical protein ACTA71_010575 [Dictyostelium dimigraforme]